MKTILGGRRPTHGAGAWCKVLHRVWLGRVISWQLLEGLRLLLKLDLCRRDRSRLFYVERYFP